jgi:hypothetical protein
MNENIGVPYITRLSSFYHNTYIEKAACNCTDRLYAVEAAYHFSIFVTA